MRKKIKRQNLIKVLPQIIENLLNNGYTFKKINELDFQKTEHTIIISTLKWDNQTHQLVYTDSEDFTKIPIEKIKQVYGICFYNKKLVIGWNQKTQMWNFQGGSIKKGEEWKDALKREIQEESNMKVLCYHPLGYQMSINRQGDIIYQLRLVCEVEPQGEFVQDPDGAVTKIKLIKPNSYKKYIDWGELGDHLIFKSLIWNKKN